eukprot:8823-Heterococcus_DN1.PRE.1
MFLARLSEAICTMQAHLHTAAADAANTEQLKGVTPKFLLVTFRANWQHIIKRHCVSLGVDTCCCAAADSSVGAAMVAVCARSTIGPKLRAETTVE